jgi:hypothetical protein
MSAAVQASVGMAGLQAMIGAGNIDHIIDKIPGRKPERLS